MACSSEWLGDVGRPETTALDATSDAVVREGDGREGGDDMWGHPVSERGEGSGSGWVGSGLGGLSPLDFPFLVFFLLANFFPFYFFYFSTPFDKTFCPKLLYKTPTNFWDIFPYFPKTEYFYFNFSNKNNH